MTADEAAGTAAERLLPFGPYAGRSVDEVAVMDPAYLADLVSAGVGPARMRAAGAQALLARPGGRGWPTALPGVTAARGGWILAGALALAAVTALALGVGAQRHGVRTPPAATARPTAAAAAVSVTTRGRATGAAAGTSGGAPAATGTAPSATAPCGQRVAGAITADGAARAVGTFQAVEFRVAATKDTGRVTFLNSRVPYQGSFYVAVFPGDYDRFPAPPADLFSGRCIVVQGTVELYRDAPQIVVRSPDDVRILEDAPPATQ